MTSKKSPIKFHTDFPDLAEQVRSWRRHRGLTQAELQTRAGLAHNAISRIETDEVSPRLETLESISSVLQISIEELQFRRPPEMREVKAEEDVASLALRLQTLPAAKRQELLRAFHALLNTVEKS
jgi:transcriptional regulator with XRE-family HTH domain